MISIVCWTVLTMADYITFHLIDRCKDLQIKYLQAFKTFGINIYTLYTLHSQAFIEIFWDEISG